MKHLVFSLLVFTTMFLNACTCSKKEDRDIAKPVSVMEAAGLVQNNFAVLIDIRELAIAKQGMPTSAIYIAEKDLDQKIANAAGSKQVIICCDNVACGQRVSADLARKGYKSSFIPSFSEWKKEAQ